MSRRLEYHLLGNHLLANAKALVFAGLFFSGGQADSWLRKGLKLLRAQLPEQILADGGHFERSPMYHAIILEDLLDLVNLAETYGHGAADWRTVVQRMLRWLNAMSHPDGGIAFFNDAAFGIAPTLAELADYARRLGVSLPPIPVAEGEGRTAGGEGARQVTEALRGKTGGRDQDVSGFDKVKERGGQRPK